MSRITVQIINERPENCLIHLLFGRYKGSLSCLSSLVKVINSAHSLWSNACLCFRSGQVKLRNGLWLICHRTRKPLSGSPHQTDSGAPSWHDENIPLFSTDCAVQNSERRVTVKEFLAKLTCEIEVDPLNETESFSQAHVWALPQEEQKQAACLWGKGGRLGGCHLAGLAAGTQSLYFLCRQTEQGSEGSVVTFPFF